MTSDGGYFWTQFHRLWTACVGTEKYHKPTWINAETQLLAAKVVVPHEEVAVDLLSKQAVTIGRHGSQVSIQCDSPEDADKILDWLERMADPFHEQVPVT